jgi:hypothetical protein
MYPHYQGALDSLCGIYSVVNAERLVNRSSEDESKKLFEEIVRFLSEKKLLADILVDGMVRKHLTSILDNVVADRMPNRGIRWQGKLTPGLNDFWYSIQAFLDGTPGRAVILGLDGAHEHWTVVKSITDRQINLYDSDSLERLYRAKCTTGDPKGKRVHILKPAQTYFICNEI